MPKYIFILGQAADLAKAELLSCLEADQDLDTIGANFVIANSPQKSSDLLAKLGGTIKIARFLEKIDSLEQLDTALWQKYLTANIKSDEKIFFGFSLYNDSQKNYQIINHTALQLKKQWQAQHYKIRLVASHQAELSSVIVAKNKLLNRELIIARQENNWFLGITEAVQDFADYGYRDIGRPYRDDKSGMLPPKVAKMLINLGANKKSVHKILDPFCGSGTILQEAMLLGYTDIYGSDISQKAVDNSLDNITWLKNHYHLSAQATIKNSPVEKLSRTFAQEKFDLIVTEPFMGEAALIQKNPDLKTLEKIQVNLQNLYHQAFKEFAKVLADKGQIVFIFPIFVWGNKKIATLDKTAISQLGFSWIKPSISSNQLSANGNVVYSRPAQKVAREISVWQKI